MKLLGASLWLHQARADRKAAAMKGMNPSHARYFLQQAYEKGVEAFGIAILSETQLKDRQFTSVFGTYFLHHHMPITVLSKSGDPDTEDELRRAYPKDWSHLLKQLRTFRHELKRQLLDGADEWLKRAWEKIDATQPSRDPLRVGYRYPFFDPDAHGTPVAPASWSGWGAYQGDESTVRRAIDELHQRAAYAVGRWAG